MPKKVDKIPEYVTILKQADIFYGLTDSQLEMIAPLCSEINPKLGATIFEENSAGDELYVIAGGEVDILVDPSLVQSITEERHELVNIATLRRGQTFGEIALVDQGLRSASARCASKKTHLLTIPRDKLTELCEENPKLGYYLMRNIATDMAFKIRGTDLMVREQLRWAPRPK